MQPSFSKVMFIKAERKKGGNNVVVSLVHKVLEQKSAFNDAKKYWPGVRLTLAFDYCGGQNKNVCFCDTYFIW